MKKIYFLSLFLSPLIVTHMHAIPPQVTTVGGTFAAMAGTVGAYYCYQKTSSIAKQLASSSLDAQTRKTLETQLKTYKILTLVSGGISIIGAGLAAWGCWQWTHGTATPTQESTLIAEKEIILGADTENNTTYSLIIKPDGSMTLNEKQGEETSSVTFFREQIEKTLASYNDLEEENKIKLLDDYQKILNDFGDIAGTQYGWYHKQLAALVQKLQQAPNQALSYEEQCTLFMLNGNVMAPLLSGSLFQNLTELIEQKKGVFYEKENFSFPLNGLCSPFTPSINTSSN